jgi:hypothetical protein
VIKLHGPRKEWSPQAVKEFIYTCRAGGGIPMFKTGFGGIRFEDGRTVLAICYAPEKPIDSKVFVRVPQEEIQELEHRVGDWKYLWNKFAPDSPLP